MRTFLENTRWGVIAGVFGILCFYLTACVIAAQFIFAQVNGQTGQIATIFDTWWQTLIFVGAVVTAVIFLAAVTLFVRKKIRNKKGGTTLEKDSK